jgi:hypothetical protein
MSDAPENTERPALEEFISQCDLGGLDAEGKEAFSAAYSEGDPQNIVITAYYKCVFTITFNPAGCPEKTYEVVCGGGITAERTGSIRSMATPNGTMPD